MNQSPTAWRYFLDFLLFYQVQVQVRILASTTMEEWDADTIRVGGGLGWLGWLRSYTITYKLRKVLCCTVLHGTLLLT